MMIFDGSAICIRDTAQANRLGRTEKNIDFSGKSEMKILPQR